MGFYYNQRLTIVIASNTRIIFTKLYLQAINFTKLIKDLDLTNLTYLIKYIEVGLRTKTVEIKRKTKKYFKIHTNVVRVYVMANKYWKKGENKFIAS